MRSLKNPTVSNRGSVNDIIQRERPIIFTPANHRLIMSGAKVQTRRVIKPQPDSVHDGEPYWNIGGYRAWEFRGISDVLRMGTANPLKCTYGQVGDKLYIKEGVIVHKDGKTLAGYYMEGARVTNLGEKRLTAMFMPKWAARTWLEITEVRIERVQDISEDDAIAEGVERRSASTWRNYFEDCSLHSAQQSYSSLWQAINGKNKPGKEWDAWDLNPFVWAITFRKI